MFKTIRDLSNRNTYLENELKDRERKIKWQDETLKIAQNNNVTIIETSNKERKEFRKLLDKIIEIADNNNYGRDDIKIRKIKELIFDSESDK